VKLLSSKRRILGIVALLVIVLFLLRPGVSRLKTRIIFSMSAAVGRPVDIGSVHLRFLPRPGFDLDNLVVYDDPAFGAEPMLRASEVTAAVRLTSLLRGRIEIARLDLTEPSLNLVHGQNGRWNAEVLIERAAHAPLGPTTTARSGPRPAFPYIEATSGRINFKNGPEKKPYALTNADFSFWQDSENTWGVRLKAQPFRSDFNLNDTGMLQISGTWQRAGTLRDTPVQLALEWSHAQLGQVTKFFTGSDQGWRGDVTVNGIVQGTPAKLQIASGVLVQDFRRYDISTGQQLRLALRCGAEYSSLDRIFHGLDCEAPVGRGLLALKGDAALPGNRNYNLVLSAENVPASAALALITHARKNLPQDLVAAGTIDGVFELKSQPAQHEEAGAEIPRFEGQGKIAELELISAANKAQIGPVTVPFALANLVGETGPHMRKGEASIPPGPRIELGPITLGRNATLAGWVNRAGYEISVEGESDIAKTLRTARLVGLPALQATAEGVAQLDLQIAGPWSAASQAGRQTAPPVTGRAKLRNVHVTVHGPATAVEISSAELQFTTDEVRVTKLSAKTGTTAWSGSLTLPRGCGTASACEIRFDLNANRISVGDLSKWVSPPPTKRPWYRVLETNAAQAPSIFGMLRASGRITTDKLQLKGIDASHVSADVSLNSGKLELSSLDADLFGGRHTGQWTADFSSKPGACSGKGSLTGFSMSQMGDALRDHWIAGTAKTNYELSGECSGDFWTSAEGTLGFEARDGSFSHVSLSENDEGLRWSRFLGNVRLRGRKLEMQNARLDSPTGKFQVSGTISLEREVELKLSPFSNLPGTRYAITGTLAGPRVEPITAEQARLKTDPAK